MDGWQRRPPRMRFASPRCEPHLPWTGLDLSSVAGQGRAKLMQCRAKRCYQNDAPRSGGQRSAIEHMRKRSDWMPVTSMSMGKCPNNAMPTQARDYLRRFVGVGRIIIVHEGK